MLYFFSALMLLFIVCNTQFLLKMAISFTGTQKVQNRQWNYMRNGLAVSALLGFSTDILL